MFYQFSVTYGPLWIDGMPTSASKAAKKAIYYMALKCYLPETVKKAVIHAIKACKYPPLPNDIVTLCEEHKLTGWKSVKADYIAIDDIQKTDEEKRVSRELAISTLAAIKKQLRMK